MKIQYPESRVQCVLVEDEPLAVRQMLGYIAKREDLSLISVARDFQDFQELMNRFSPQIIFLDIRIPGSNGDIVKLFREVDSETVLVIVSAIPLITISKGLDIPNLYELPKPVSLRKFNLCVNEVVSRIKKP